MSTSQNAFCARPPTLWQRIKWWHRWPWWPEAVGERSWDAEWVTIVRQNGVPIGWHLDEKRPTGLTVGPDRWACLYGLVTGRLRFDAEIQPGERWQPGRADAPPPEVPPMKTAEDDILTAAVALVGRTGARDLTIGYSDEHVPPVWFAAATYRQGHEAGGAMTPLGAVLRLLDALVDGGQCTHCKRPTGVVVELGTMPLADAICWYQYDPELKTFRRGCE